MWFRLGVQNFIGRKITHNDCYELYISNFARLWHSSMSNDELASISQKLNPLFEAPVQKHKEIISNLLQDEKAEKEIREDNNSIILNLKSNKLGVKFLFQIVLPQQNEEIFYKEFTLPLLLTFIQMQNREKKLVKIITDKDEEIKEYKQEFGALKSSFMATEPFNKEEFDSQESLSSICDINSFFECINLILPKAKTEQSSREMLKNGSAPCSDQKSITNNKKTIFKDTNSKSGLVRCVKLEHQTIKKRKKQTDTFKIKF